MPLDEGRTGTEFYRRWSPRVGAQAVDAYVNCSRQLLLAWCSWWLGAMPCYFLLIEEPTERLLWVPFVGFGVAGTVWWVRSLRYGAEFRRLVGERFGIQVGFRNAPGLRSESNFEHWRDVHVLGSAPLRQLGSFAPRRQPGPSAAFLRTLAVICGALAAVSFVGLVVPGVPSADRPGWALAAFLFGVAMAALVRLAKSRPPALPRGGRRRALGRVPVE